MTDFEITMDMSIRQGSGNLNLRETVTIPDCTFSDMTEILQGFYQLASSIAAAKKKAAGTVTGRTPEPPKSREDRL